MIIAFCMKEWMFDVILAPARGDFVTYRLMGTEPVSIHLINTGLTEQFMMHLKASFHVGLLAVMPYILYVLFGFIAPGLYERERHYAVRVVSSDVQNMLTLESYMDTLVTMNLMLGIVFQLPVLCWLLAVTGMLRPEWMTRYRRHAIVAIVVVAAIITPTTDAFTLIIVALPIWLLYEVSIWIVKKTRN